MPVKFTVRLIGINAPEMNPRLFEWNREDTKKRACLARNALIQLTTNARFDSSDFSLTAEQVQQVVDTNTRLITIRCHRNDAFGRVLGTLEVDNVNVNDIMVQSGHASPFVKEG
eukprot:jgi/Mesvir1/6749/Mv01544-RA.1